LSSSDGSAMKTLILCNLRLREVLIFSEHMNASEFQRFISFEICKFHRYLVHFMPNKWYLVSKHNPLWTECIWLLRTPLQEMCKASTFRRRDTFIFVTCTYITSPARHGDNSKCDNTVVALMKSINYWTYSYTLLVTGPSILVYILIENQQMHQVTTLLWCPVKWSYMFRRTNAIISELIWSSHAIYMLVCITRIIMEFRTI
jgi:hypothetical protein